MKLSYKAQQIVSLVIILLANVISTLLKHWIYRSAGFVACGLLWSIHPVLPQGTEISDKALLWTRIAGVILILIGIFTRAYIY
ncbi:MAG: hypothetical protein E7470_08875 [Ruminococcaceae bacterium]|nr:hypothetical protein [Oscillospiraceae bacterium]